MHSQNSLEEQDQSTRRKVAMGVTALFVAEFISLLFANARNITQPGMIAEFNGMALFSWLIALPALAGAVGTMLFGKLSDVYGRRVMILLSIAIFILGLVISAMSTSMIFLIIATAFMSIGHWPILPLCYAVVGDLFPPSQRAKWTGLLNIPVGFSALIGPVLGGVFAESVWGWRGLFWCAIPLVILSGVLVSFALPNYAQKVKPKIDLPGTFVMVIASATLILGFSWLGVPDKFKLGILQLFISLVAWVVFIQIEKRAESPILDPKVLFNRIFLTAALTGLLSFFGTVVIVGYSTIFVQNVMSISPTISGTMLTPYSTLVAFTGVPVGFLLSKTKKYRGLYILGYGLVALGLLAMWRFTGHTPIWLYILVTGVAGLGMGMIPTINTVVVQFAVPKDLLGVAVGAIFFFQMVGISVSPAILGFAQSGAPDLESGLKAVFLAGAIVMAVAWLIILTIPEISLEQKTNTEAEPAAVTASGEAA